MAPEKLVLALSMIAATSPVSAMSEDRTRTTAAPSGTSATRYCMRIEAVTGSRVERIKCWTRDEWAAQDVDVDRNWFEDGVRTIG